MNIRLFNDKDSEHVILLLKEFLDYTRKSYSNKVLEFDDFIDYKKNMYVKEILKNFRNQKNSRFLVAHENLKIIGYIIGSIEKNPNKVMKKAGHINSFFVSSKYRNLGIGKKLYLSLVEWFKKNKCDHLELEVFDGNKKTISMYKKWGFKENTLKMKKRL